MEIFAKCLRKVRIHFGFEALRQFALLFAWDFGVAFATLSMKDRYLEELKVFKNTIPRKA